MVCLRSYALLGIAGYADPDGGLRAMGRSRGGAALRNAVRSGTAGRRPNRGCGPRTAAEATRHNVTKPHRPRTHQDAGREWASGVAWPEYASSRSKRLKAPLAVDSDGVAGLKWTRGEVRYWSRHADVGRAELPSVCICNRWSRISITNCKADIQSLLSIGY